MLIEAGLKPAVTPDDRPVALRFTGPVNPASGVTVTVNCAADPGTRFRDAGVTVTAKSAVVDAGAEVTNVL